jgi:hypothetical protein
VRRLLQSRDDAQPTPVGGVTSNVLGPYTANTQFDSIRFDGTGYIDYGNAASSVMTTNLWANAWTIEAWVYVTAQGVANFILSRAASAAAFDFQFYLTNTNPMALGFAYGSSYYTGGSGSISYNTWSHVAAVYNAGQVTLYANGTTNLAAFTPTAAGLTFNTTYSVQVSNYPGYGGLIGNLADVRVSNVARYTGSSYTVPNVADGSGPFVTDRNTLLLLKSLGGQVGTTLEIQGRGLNAVSLGATRSVQSYPPAPMSSYLLDTTSNASVTYGQGKYVASASTESTNPWPAWQAFDGSQVTYWQDVNSSLYSSSSPYGYIASVTTVDVLGNPWAGEWCQLQLPVSVLLSSYSVQGFTAPYGPASWVLLGSRDGTNWTFVDRRTGITWSGSLPVTIQTFTVNVTQAYNYYRYIVLNTVGNSQPQGPTIATLSFSGTEESLCITNDAKVGVGIANPQRTMEIAGDLVVSGTISGGAGMGAFRNRIINGDMRIAQRGTSNVLVSGTACYMIDRFNVNPTFSAGTITQYQTALAASDTPYQIGFRNYMNVFVSVGATTTVMIPGQNLEGYTIQDLNWGTSFGSPVTLSFWFRTNAPANSQFTYSMLGASGTVSYVGTFVPIPGIWQYWSFTVPPPPNGTTFGSGSASALGVYIAPYYPAGAISTVNAWNTSSYLYFANGSYNWTAQAGNYVHITGVQLEKGSVATPFDARPYATELQLCQRYYQLYNTSGGSGVSTGILGIGHVGSATVAQFAIPLKVSMRVGPTAFSNTAVGNYALAQGGTGYAITGFAMPYSSSELVWFQTANSGTIPTVGGAVILYGANSSGFLAFSAEL